MAKARDSNARERSLYECFHARVKGERIYCEKGHDLQEPAQGDGTLNIEWLARGEPLVMSICQDCADFESMGGPIPSEERGWLEEMTEADLQIQERENRVSQGNKERVIS